MASTGSFGIVDYIVFAVMLAISAAIGIYYRFSGGKQKTINEYFLAGKNMSILPVAFSLMASFMSAITLLGVSSENYNFGTQFIVINLAYGLATPIAACWYLPVFYKLQATSAYEYLERRFGLVTRLVASSAFSLQMILYMGIVLFAPALALSAVTGISKIGAILSVGFVCTFYSTIGGMKAVLITDLFQSVLMFAAVTCVVIMGSVEVGGLNVVWERAEDRGRVEFFNIDPDPTTRHTVWTMLIGGIFTYLPLYAVNQAQVQRLLCVKSLKDSQRALWVSWPILTILSIITSLSGLAIFANYYDCDPLETKKITSADQLLPLYVVESMGNIPGLPGLFVSGIFSGSLSTVSSAVNSLAAVTLEDYVQPIYSMMYKIPMSDTKKTVCSKLLALFYGLACIGLAFVAEQLGGVLQASLTIFGVVGGPLLGVFTLGMFFIHTNQVGAVVGLLSGLSLSLWIGFGGPKPPLPYLPRSTEGCNLTTTTQPDFYNNSISSTIASMLNVTTSSLPNQSVEYFPLYKISYMWYAVIGFLVTVIIGVFVSWIKNLICYEERKVNPDLFSPLISKCVKKHMRAGTLPGGSIINDSFIEVPKKSYDLTESEYMSSL